MTDTSDEGTSVRVGAPAPPPASYEVVIRTGALQELGALAAAAAPAAQYAVLAPRTVAGLYGGTVLSALERAGLRARLVEFEDGEEHKTRATWAMLTDRLLSLGLGRDSCVIALGGGVAGDVAGFVAATYMRGVPVVQVPTSLLAMVDASVGGKTGVDTEAGKNLVGVFHPPSLVVADPGVLRTLPATELRAGLAEAVKHGAILDAGYFDWIAGNLDAVLAADGATLERLVRRSVELKAGIVREDPFEKGRRAILNFGHTVGHALERQSGYRLLHGYAVALGMIAEAIAGERLGVTAKGTTTRLRELLHRCGLPVTSDAPDVDDLLAAMRLDKKSRAGTPRLALLRHVGTCEATADGAWVHAVPDAVLAECIRALATGTDAV